MVRNPLNVNVTMMVSDPQTHKGLFSWHCNAYTLSQYPSKDDPGMPCRGWLRRLKVTNNNEENAPPESNKEEGEDLVNAEANNTSDKSNKVGGDNSVAPSDDGEEEEDYYYGEESVNSVSRFGHRNDDPVANSTEGLGWCWRQTASWSIAGQESNFTSNSCLTYLIRYPVELTFCQDPWILDIAAHGRFDPIENLNCFVRLKKVEEFDMNIPDCQADEDLYKGQGSCKAKVMREAIIPQCKEDEMINFVELETKKLWPEYPATAPQPCFTWIRKIGEIEGNTTGTTPPGGTTGTTVCRFLDLNVKV